MGVPGEVGKLLLFSPIQMNRMTSYLPSKVLYLLFVGGGTTGRHWQYAFQQINDEEAIVLNFSYLDCFFSHMAQSAYHHPTCPEVALRPPVKVVSVHDAVSLKYIHSITGQHGSMVPSYDCIPPRSNTVMVSAPSV